MKDATSEVKEYLVNKYGQSLTESHRYGAGPVFASGSFGQYIQQNRFYHLNFASHFIKQFEIEDLVKDIQQIFAKYNMPLQVTSAVKGGSNFVLEGVL